MKINAETEIQIRQVLFKSDEPVFVEFYSQEDSRNHILNVDRFMDVFGYTIAELKAHSNA